MYLIKIIQTTYRSHIVENKMIDICIASFSHVSYLNVKEKIKMYKYSTFLETNAQYSEQKRERREKKKNLWQHCSSTSQTDKES